MDANLLAKFDPAAQAVAAKRAQFDAQLAILDKMLASPEAIMAQWDACQLAQREAK